MPNIGPLEIGIILVIVLIIFGPKKLPDLGRSLGSSIREFKGGIGGGSDDDEKDEKQVEKTTETESAGKSS
jgi:sec-independent protein translocase protein TatA